MLNQKTIQQIEKLLSIEPRSINEIAEKLNKNWRTIDRYVKQIEEEYGTIETKTFRGGTRGALKIAFLSTPEKISETKFQEELEHQILTLRRKEEFSGFDIYQHISDKHKKVTIEEEETESKTNLKELNDILNRTKKELKVFSGNLSWINNKNKEINLFETLEKLIQKNIRVKILCRVDLDGLENVKKVLGLNYKYGKDLIEIRHKEHPIRSFIIDDKMIRMKDIKEPSKKIKELKKRIYLFYTIKDKDWTEWLGKIFTKMFNTSIGSEKRLKELESILK